MDIKYFLEKNCLPAVDHFQAERRDFEALQGWLWRWPSAPRLIEVCRILSEKINFFLFHILYLLLLFFILNCSLSDTCLQNFHSMFVSSLSYRFLSSFLY